MSKSWGLARFGKGGMEYLLKSGEWLADRKLYDGAPVLLFESMSHAEAQAPEIAQGVDSHGVQFMVDHNGDVLTISAHAAKSAVKRRF